MQFSFPLAQILPFDESHASTQDTPLKETTTVPGYHAPSEKWLIFHNWQNGARSILAFLLILLLGLFVIRKFKNLLQRHRLRRATYAGIFTIAFYVALWVVRFGLMKDPTDILSATFHRTFVAIMLFVVVRYIDRLIILALLTHILGRPPSRFVHQVIVAILSIFVIAGYCSWAFGIELGSFVAGSAAISIILGLALQETLGNFFAGMVLQASTPFKAGDWIQLGSDPTVEGRVVEMTWRAVTLVTGSNNYIYIPNSQIARDRIINYHAPSTATSTSVTLNLDYNLDPNTVKQTLIQSARDCDGVLTNPPPSAGLASFADTSIQYRLSFWVDLPNRRAAVEDAVRINLWYRLNQAGLNIPFSARAVLMPDVEKNRNAALQASQATRLTALKSCDLFTTLPAESLEKLASETRDFSLTAGQWFYRQNDPGHSLFLLLSGTIAISIETPDTPPRSLDAGEASAPYLFGQTAAFTGLPRTRTIRAKTDIRALEITHNQLHTLLATDPALAHRFSQAVVQNQSQRDDFLKKYSNTSSSASAQTPDESDSILDRVTQFFSRFNQ